MCEVRSQVGRKGERQSLVTAFQEMPGQGVKRELYTIISQGRGDKN